MASGQGDSYTVALRAGEVFDRFQLRENTLLGQRIRHYTIEQGNATATDMDWQHIVSGKLPRYRRHLGCILLKMPAISLLTGQAVGIKRIILLPERVVVPSGGLTLRLRIDEAVARPIVSLFGVFRPCFPNNTAL